MKYILTEKNNSYGIALVLEQENEAETVEAYENLTTDKARIELEWVATHTIEDMCRDAWNWQKKNPNGYEE